MGLAMVVATVRALFYKDSNALSEEDQNASFNHKVQRINIGNYWADVIRPTFRFLIPLCMVWSLLLNSQGVPSTFQGGPEAQVIDQTTELVPKFHWVQLHQWWLLNSWVVMVVVGMGRIVVCHWKTQHHYQTF